MEEKINYKNVRPELFQEIAGKHIEALSKKTDSLSEFQLLLLDYVEALARRVKGDQTQDVQKIQDDLSSIQGKLYNLKKDIENR